VLSLGSCFVWLSLSKIREARVSLFFKLFCLFVVRLAKFD